MADKGDSPSMKWWEMELVDDQDTAWWEMELVDDQGTAWWKLCDDFGSEWWETELNGNSNWIWEVQMGEGAGDVDMGTGTEDVNEGAGTSQDSGQNSSQDEFYTIEQKRETRSKKFKSRAMDYTIRFNNTNADLSILQEHERVQHIFENMLNDITEGMDESDQIRFVLRSTQLNTPISLPFMPVSHLTPERVFSQVERVVQSNQSFSLNDTVVVDIFHVMTPNGSGKSKRAQIDLGKYLHSKTSVTVIKNRDELCLARALVVAIAKIEKVDKYKLIIDSRSPLQGKKAKELHEKADVPLGPCGIAEVKLFQRYLTGYEINIVSADHQNAIIHPSVPNESDVKSIYLYLHNKHYDVINSMPAFFSRGYFCHSCRRTYDVTLQHVCPNMCLSCRGLNCLYEVPVSCQDCNRMFRSQSCYLRHKQPIGKGRSVCEGVKKCTLCMKTLRYCGGRLEKHLCKESKCTTCHVVVADGDDTHQCFMQKCVKKVTEHGEEEDMELGEEDMEEDMEVGEGVGKACGYDQLMFFDYECRQEDGIHKPNLCVVHNEAGDEWVFKGEDTNSEFCKWLFTNEHRDCIFVAHNFQGYDGYFIQKYLNLNAVKYEVILRGAKILTLNVPMFNIKFIDSLNFIPSSLAKFPETFGFTELCKGYFPHIFNRRENQDYVGPIPPEAYYCPNGMKAEQRKIFLQWHKEQREIGNVFDFGKEILKYCRSDVDILRRCCMEFRELFRNVTDIDPFESCLTIASACSLVYRTNFLKEKTIAIFSSNHTLKAKQSNMAVRWLSFVAEKEDIPIEHVKNGGEKRVGRYSLDGYSPDRHTAYEFQGCFWHGCVKCYARGTVNSVNRKTMQELHEATLRKNLYLRSQGLNLVEMWECDLKKELKQDEEMKRYFDEYELVDPLQPREAFYGGRTNAVKLFHECKDGEEIRYVDFTSLYPWCNKTTKTVMGHPQIITENFDDISTYFGLVKCTVLPPRGLFHPVLPYPVPGKLMFPLCKTCADTLNKDPCTHSDRERAILGAWCHIELAKALEKGYRILKIHEVWHFPEQTEDLFKGYVDTFLKIKQEASGFPKGCVTEEQKQDYVRGYFEHEGIQLDMGKITYNPGLRALAKLMLNSLWGKFAQRSNMSKTEMVTDPGRYYDLLFSDEFEVCDARIVNDNMIEVQYKNKSEFVESNDKTNVVIAAFTTAYARLKLYDLLDMLQERVLYYDTDSVVYVSEKDKPDPPLGDYLGDLTDELKGDYITTFVSGGPKNYAYRTNGGKSDTRIRGITMNHSTSEKIGPDTIRALVHLHVKCNTEAKVTVDIPFKITRDKKEKNIVTKRTKKDYRVVYDKRVILEDFGTLPYGF